MKLENNKQSIELNILGYEYPPGWGAGMPYETDWLQVLLKLDNGSEAWQVEDTLLRFSELSGAYDNILPILEGSQWHYQSDFTDPRFSLRVDVVDERDIFVEMAYMDEEREVDIRKELSSEAFRGFVQDLEDILVSHYRPSL